ncbi:hypothetical protein BH10ACT3_BH10ACT3_15010 [soil metagenome]
MTRLDATDPDTWRQVRATLRHAGSSSLHCAIASIAPDGRPHVTPIGSVMLGQPGHGVYLDVLNVELGRNIDRDPRIAVMAVDSGRRTWVTALVRGRFDTPPGVRLLGTAGPARPLTDDERDRFRRRVRLALRTKGGAQLWGRDGNYRARDLVFTDVVPVHVPRMTRDLWMAPAVEQDEYAKHRDQSLDHQEHHVEHLGERAARKLEDGTEFDDGREHPCQNDQAHPADRTS